ncbi:hypothetical protein [Pseudomonas mediterranea]|uniref:hypothetical protein n=1 Tax=Pseudomonas mediterranea TaxID=183795 RepID=UPI0006D8C119|nr:hypothetical protein [Pseudomonas mediterranea]
MPSKNYLCTSLANGATHYTAVFDPVTQGLILKTQWNPTLMSTTISTMTSELQTIYGGDATVDVNVQRFIGVSTTGEAVWAIGLAATDAASAEFRNYVKVMAYSNTTARTVASLNQSTTKKAGENFAQPLYLLGYGHERAYFSGYATGAAPNLRVYEATSTGVVVASCSAASALTPEVAGLMFTTESYLSFGALSAGNQAAYLLQKVSGTWGQVATVAGASPTLFPMSQLTALATAGSIAPVYTLAFGSNSETVPVPQGKDSLGSFSIDGATLTNLVTASTADMQPTYNATVGGTATVDKTRQAFVYADFPVPAFWQGKVLADEIV